MGLEVFEMSLWDWNWFIRTSLGLEWEEPQTVVGAFYFWTKKGVANPTCTDLCHRGIQSIRAWCLLPGAPCRKSKGGKAFCERALGLVEHRFQPQGILIRELWECNNKLRDGWIHTYTGCVQYSSQKWSRKGKCYISSAFIWDTESSKIQRVGRTS